MAEESQNAISELCEEVPPSRPLLDPSRAVLVLGLVTMIWGAQHAIIKETLSGKDGLEAATLNLVRFSLAALCFSPWLPLARKEDSLKDRENLEWRGGAELGLWLFLGFCLQAAGMLYTTAQRSGLLLYLNVKLVPFFAFAVFGREVPLTAWLLAAAALLGTFLVAGDGATGVPLNIGDVLSLAAAAASAMFILRLEVFAPATEPKALNAVSMLTVACLCIPWVLLQACWVSSLAGEASPLGLVSSGFSTSCGRVSALLQDHLPAVLYLGVFTTAFTNWLQTLGQQSVPATTASVIYALDPLWGCVVAYLWLGETLGSQGLLGCGILLGVWIYQLAATRTGGREEQRSGP